MRTAKLALARTLTLVVSLTLMSCGNGDSQDGLKVVIIYDMEGLIPVQTSRDCSFGSPTYAASRESLTQEVNAAIRGLLAGGATEIVITDGHGSGNPEPDYDLSQLPEGARFEIRDNPYDAYIDVFDEDTDAVVAIGMHAGAGTPGVISHTYYGHTRWVINGEPINESALVAASAARFGAPLILVAGDDVLRDQVEAFNPATRFALTKTAISRSQAEARPTEDVLADIEAKAQDAIQALAEIPAWTPELVNGTLTNQFSYTRTDHATLAVEFPGAVAVNDRTIALEFQSWLDSYLAYRALANFTSLAPMRGMFDAMQEVDGGMDTYRRIQERLAGQMVIGFEPTGDDIDMSGSPRGKHGYK
jgi:D-amino peptidase